MSANEQLRPISSPCEEIACQIIPLGYMLDLKIKNPRVRKHHGGHKRYHLQKLLAGGYKSMAIISSTQPERNPQSFWNTPAMRSRLERGGPLAVCAKNAPTEALKSEALYKESKNDLDQDLDLRKLRSGSIRIDLNDPDGLDHKIVGPYASLLKQDPDYLQARAWKVHPAQLTNATKRMGADWVRQQVQFVAAKKGIKSPGRYLAVILARNPY